MTELITIKGLDKLIKKFDDMAQMKPLKAAIKAGGYHIRGAMECYPKKHRPTRKSVYGSSFQSDRQRKWFFASLRDGSLQVPYKRTARLKHGWTVKTKDRGMTAVIGNAVSYGPFVQSPEQQSAYMTAVGWKTTEQVAEKEKKTIIGFIQEAINRLLAK